MRGRSEVTGMAGTSSTSAYWPRPEIRQPGLARDGDLDQHRHPNRGRFHVDEPGEHSHTLLELHKRDHVRHLSLELGRCSVNHGELIDRASTADGYPFQVDAAAMRAKRARVKDMPPAALAALHIEPAGGHRVPEGCGLGVGNRVRLLHQSRPRTSVAAELSTPPVPLARARLAPSTWRGPHSPLSWRVASIMVKIPYMPGWQ